MERQITAPEAARSWGVSERRTWRILAAYRKEGATAHKLARLIYAMLRFGQQYVDLGQDYYESLYRERALRNLTRRAKELGYMLVATEEPDLLPASAKRGVT